MPVDLEVRLPGHGVHGGGGATEPKFLSGHVTRQVLDPRLEVVVAGLGVVAPYVERGECGATRGVDADYFAPVVVGVSAGRIGVEQRYSLCELAEEWT